MSAEPLHPDPDIGLRERAQTIRERLRTDMRATMSGSSAVVGSVHADDFENLLDDLVSDAMFQVEILLREVS